MQERAVLYQGEDGSAFGLIWLLEELGRDYVLKTGGAGQTPRVVDELGIVYRHPAIAYLYLSVRHSAGDIGVRPDERGYSGYLETILRTNPDPQAQPLPGDADDPEVCVTELRQWCAVVLGWLERMLLVGEYVSAGRFTAADISVGCFLLLASRLGLEANVGPRTRAYWIRLRKRAAYKRAQKREFIGALRYELGLVRDEGVEIRANRGRQTCESETEPGVEYET